MPPGHVRGTLEEAFRYCLRGGLSAGFGAEAFWSHDIGGFCGAMPSPELYIRWMQLGFLSPFTRFHGNGLREPWHYGETATSVAQHYGRLRYRLIPYLLAAAEEVYARGTPLQRHLALEFQGQPGVDGIDDQLMLGPDLLLAPVLVRGGALVPAYRGAQQHRKQPVPETVVLTAWSSDRERLRELTFDDGRGRFIASHVSGAAGGVVRVAASGRRVELRLVDVPAGSVRSSSGEVRAEDGGSVVVIADAAEVVVSYG